MTPTESPHSPGLTDLVFLRRIDGAWLAALRVLLGLTLAVSMERFIAYGWIDDLLLKPRFHFKYWGFSWVQPLGHQQMHLLFHGLVGLGICVAVGLFFRVTAPLFALGLTYIQLIDVSTYLNHYYLAALLMWLLAVSPAHRMGSVDAWACRPGRPEDGRGRASSRGEGDGTTMAAAVDDGSATADRGASAARAASASDAEKGLGV